MIDRKNGMLFLTSASKLGHGGIGIFLSGKLKDHYLSKEKVSDRILVVRLDTNPHVAFINAYAPTEGANDQSKDNFYDDLGNTVEALKPHCLVLLAGDFNAHVGLDSHQSCPQVVDRNHDYERTNENSDWHQASEHESTRKPALGSVKIPA
jgi:exonuclease III